MFLYQKEASHCRDSPVIVLTTSFTRKMPESSDSLCFSIFMVKEHMILQFYLMLTEFEIVNFVVIMGPRGPKLN